MGICGLTKFIHESTPPYLENHRLKDSTVIIDGFNLTNSLYTKFENNTSAFGGDYDIMVKVYVDFINWLIKCKVIPIFVFDGAREARKIETIKKRMIDKIKVYGKPIKTSACKPHFNSDIIFNILNEMDIPFINCDYEADAEISVLAKLLKCPIISDDSDFYLTTVPCIPLKTIILDFKSEVISCKLYKVEKLLNHFGGLDLEFLPLVAVLLGNDYIKPGTFSCLLGLSSNKFGFDLKLSRIINWLRKQPNVNSAIDIMTRRCDQNKDIEDQIRIIINSYKSKDSNYLSVLLKNKNMSKYQDELKGYVKKNVKSILPQWLEDIYRKGTIASEVITILTLKSIFFKVQIEDYTERPYYEVSFEIVERILGLLFENTSTYPYFGRTLNSSIGAIRIQGENNLRAYVNNVPLAKLYKADIEVRKNVILNLIGIKNFNGIPKEWELFVLVLIYWATRTNNHKTKYVHALIACAIKLKIVDKMNTVSQNNSMENSCDKSIIEKNIIKVKKEDCSLAMSAFLKYEGMQPYSFKCSRKSYYNIIHPYAQFQGCLNYFMMLNSLLNFPFYQCRIDNFFKGSLLYNLCIKMEDGRNPEDFVSSQLFSKSCSLNEVYISIINFLYKLMSVSKKRGNADFSISSEPQKTRKTRWS